MIIALLFASFAEHYWHVAPCHYCLYQRYIFAASAFFFLIRPLHFLGFLALLAGLCLSFYHIGLEHHFWSDFLNKCQTPLANFATAVDLKNAIKEAPIVRCDQVNWRILRISATLWTAAFQMLLLLLYCMRVQCRDRKN